MKNSSINIDNLNASLEKFIFSHSPSQRADFYGMMSALMDGGKPLDSCLRELHARYKQKKRPIASLLAAWSSSMAEGKTFGAAIKGYASETEVVILSASEKSGELPSGFTQAALVAQSSKDIRNAILAEMTTPVVQVIILLVMMIGFSTDIAPQLTQSIPMSAMDDSQKALFGLSGIIAKTWYLIIPALIGMFMISIWSMPRYTGKLRPQLDKVAPWSIYRVYSSSTFLISLSALIKAGIPIETAIRFIKNQSSPWLADHLAVMAGRMRAGSEQGTALDTGLLSDRLSDMVAIYSKTSSFDVAVSTIGTVAIKDGIQNIKTKASVVKTISTLAIGAMVAWIFLSMLGISDAAQRASNQASQASSAKAPRR
ncbi:hypothetical protein CBP36_19945 (plasmid) [Acidovorax carolinensis]|uniref:Type II secretion system protein GspF domain-containing protein n=1 Tax=Acidovorax carolinensis TaxID=553814 RepID=A0A240UIB8_9BURK|nr:type II secretion system F family protein [Acidovorax carolinensis]ART57183.1 hypothetical protein CBP35_19915 [Acidovorax carolinensis]ART61241.1 hypothetical protein CBP36_19945 [Acidovorax carolinensis]